MFPTEKEAERNRNHAEEVSTFKAKIFAESDAKFFIESEIPEAIASEDEAKDETEDTGKKPLRKVRPPGGISKRGEVVSQDEIEDERKRRYQSDSWRHE